VITLNKYVTKIPVILGATAVGKTEVSLLLAERMGGEIVSADAFQVYRGMDIGTAKSSPDELSRIPHHLIDILELNEQYSVFQFRSLALSAIEDIRSRGSIPMVAGGSGLYIKALVDGLFESPPADQEYRDFLWKEEDEKGPGYLHNLLSKEDPDSADRIHPNNIKRVIRALEVLKLTGVPISRWQKQWKGGEDEDERRTSNVERRTSNAAEAMPTTAHCPLPTAYSMIGLRRDREDLYNRINRRVLEMFDLGLVDETRELLEKGLLENRVACQALGYMEVRGYLAGEYGRDEAIKRLSTKTRHFAKRQLTWWRQDDRIQWIDISENDRAENVASRIMEISIILNRKGNKDR
jgi:tRNA dimethylallyltransferase